MSFKITIFICALWLGTGLGNLFTNQKMYKIEKNKVWYLENEKNDSQSYQSISQIPKENNIRYFYTTDKSLYDFIIFKILFIITLIGVPIALYLNQQEKKKIKR